MEVKFLLTNKGVEDIMESIGDQAPEGLRDLLCEQVMVRVPIDDQMEEALINQVLEEKDTPALIGISLATILVVDKEELLEGSPEPPHWTAMMQEKADKEVVGESS